MKTKPTREGPGRPRGFCTNAALDAAMRVFAEKGFDGASLADLTEAMGINRPSMYAAFGNKEELYLKAVERYAEVGGEQINMCLGSGTARDAINRLLRDAVARYTNPEAVGPCFVTQGPLSADDISPEGKRAFEQKRTLLETALRRRFEHAIVLGELPKHVSATDLARYYAVVMQGLALQAQHGGTREQLERVVDVAMMGWPVAAAAKRPAKRRA